MAGEKNPEHLRVIIVGGSISGLTLAHCLDLNPNVEYIVLEGRDNIHPEVEASITLTWSENGQLLTTSDAPALMKKRTGYAMAFLTCRNLLKILYSNIKDKSKIMASKRVTDVQVSSSGVTVTCQDGSSYDGDIVVDADGVHSVVRGKMQDQIELSRPGAVGKDKNSISTEYSCIFGLGKQPEGSVLTVGDSHRTYGKDHSTLSFVGRDGVLYWFMLSKLDRRYHGKEMPRFGMEDMEEGAKPFKNIPIAPGVTFGEVWENRTIANMSCLEESQNQHWISDRMVCIGDSTHKMTPNLGAGGNAAMESSATLANHIARLPTKPSQADILKTLDAFYAKRNSRANLTCDVANKLTRIESLDTIGDKIMALYVVPKLGDALWDLTCETIMGAESIESLPLPTRSQESTMAWDPESGIGKKESVLTRACGHYRCWSIRRGNLTTTSCLMHTLLSAAYQVKGPGFIAPIYYFLHYIQSPLSMYAAPDNRLTNMASAKVIIPTIATAFILPSIAIFAALGIANRQWINGVFFQPFPLYASLIHRLLTKTVKDTTQVDRIENVKADMKWLRLAYGFAAATAATAYFYVALKSPVSLTEVFFKGLSNPSEALPLITGAAKIFRYDQITAFTAGAVWVFLSFKDLKKAKKIQTRWPGIVGTFAGTTILAGPGAGMAVMWAWREECLAKKEVDETKKIQ
ncbi:hypothetical protein DL95DRAFT_424887 [Leptodontidium sp. 2 PMI_412]|nr:hypothetical protein DL95DRAFT_424887 [Leptodontidium sp. 2 PMI_412]